MKRTIRLTESELKRLISESISKIMEDKYPNPQGRPESRTNPYPEYTSDFDDEDPMFPIPNSPRLHTLDRTTDSFSDWRKGDHAYYDDGEVYPSAEWSDTDMYGRPSHHSQWAIDADKDLEKMQNQRFKDNLDKQWQDTKDKEKYSKMADSRPLHRKGSLNRAMEEAIRKTVNKILREEVDMGQLDAMKKTPSKDAPAEVKKEIRRLRQQIDDYEQKGKDISTLQKKIQQLKDKYYN